MQDIKYITWVAVESGAAFTNPDHAGHRIGQIVNNHVVVYLGTQDAATRVAAAINAELPGSGLTFANLLG